MSVSSPSLRVAVALLAAGLLASPAAAASRVLWLEDALPPEEQRLQVERTTGPATHLDRAELTWPVEDAASSQANQALAELRLALGECQARWLAFDVERGVAWQLSEAIAAVGLLSAEPDRELLWQALLLQGAAVHQAWPPLELQADEEAAPFLVIIGGDRTIGAWVDALGLFPEREPARSELPDQASYEALLRLRKQLSRARPAVIESGALPPGSRLVVDGLPVDPDLHRLELRPGRHWLHLDRQGVISTPQQPRLGPGDELVYEGLISRQDYEVARDRVLGGQLEAVPASVRERVAVIGQATPDEELYLAAWRGRGSADVYPMGADEPWSQGEYDRPLMVLAGLALGAGPISSTAFQEASADAPFVTAATVLDIEGQLAWRRWAGLIEVAIHDTSGRATMEFGDTVTQTNVTTSSFTRISLAPAFYILRLRPRRIYLALASPTGLLTPAHSGIGLQARFGLPMGQTTWLHTGLDIWRGNELPGYQALDDHDDQLNVVTFRLGVTQKAW